MKTGQVRHELACGHCRWTGRPQYPLGRVWVAMLILSSAVDHHCDLGDHVEDDVVDVAAVGGCWVFSGVRSLPKSDAVGRCGQLFGGVARAGCPALFAERLGELPAEPLVLLGEFPVSF